MDIHLVRVPQDVDVVNVRWKAAKWGERPAFFSVHVDSYGFTVSSTFLIFFSLQVQSICSVDSEKKNRVIVREITSMSLAEFYAPTPDIPSSPPGNVISLVVWWFNPHSPYARIRHLSVAASLSFQYWDRECKCRFFFISTKFNGLIFNMMLCNLISE